MHSSITTFLGGETQPDTDKFRLIAPHGSAQCADLFVAEFHDQDGVRCMRLTENTIGGSLSSPNSDMVLTVNYSIQNSPDVERTTERMSNTSGIWRVVRGIVRRGNVAAWHCAPPHSGTSSHTGPKLHPAHKLGDHARPSSATRRRGMDVRRLAASNRIDQDSHGAATRRTSHQSQCYRRRDGQRDGAQGKLLLAGHEGVNEIATRQPFRRGKLPGCLARRNKRHARNRIHRCAREKPASAHRCEKYNDSQKTWEPQIAVIATCRRSSSNAAATLTASNASCLYLWLRRGRALP